MLVEKNKHTLDLNTIHILITGLIHLTRVFVMKPLKNRRHSTAAYALLLATSPAWAQVKDPSARPGATPEPPPDEPTAPSTRSKERPSQLGLTTGKTPLSIDSVTLDPADSKKVRSCSMPKVKVTPKKPEQEVLSLAFNPRSKHVIKLNFDISQFQASEKERVLALLYSRCLVDKPQIQTPMSKKKLSLNTNDLETLATYSIPKAQSVPSPNRVGESGSSAIQMSFTIDLELEKLRQQVEAGNDTFYFQAALIDKSDFEQKKFGLMALSQVEAIHVTPGMCLTNDKYVSQFQKPNTGCTQIKQTKDK